MMPDPTMSEVVAEAYASNPVGVVVWETLEIWHPVFAQPIRVVADRVALDARIEAGAARNAGEVVTFAPYPFTAVPPDMQSTSIPQATIEIDNVTREIGQQLDAAIIAGETTVVIWRSYLSGHQMDGPEHVPPLQMEVKAVSMPGTKVVVTVGFRDLLNQAFPALVYDTEVFAGLLP